MTVSCDAAAVFSQDDVNNQRCLIQSQPSLHEYTSDTGDRCHRTAIN